jgi:hypothetical protein
MHTHLSVFLSLSLCGSADSKKSNTVPAASIKRIEQPLEQFTVRRAITEQAGL